MSTEEGSLQTIDCRGMQGPALFAELARAIKKQAVLPAQLQILATDENFPSEIEDWSTISKHRVEALSKGEDGVYTAHLMIEDTRPKPPTSAPSNPSRANPIVVPARAVTPPASQPVSTSAPTNTGIPIPEPESEAPDITAGSTRIEAAPTKSSKPEAPKSSASIPLPINKTGAAPVVPKSSVNIPLPASNKTGANFALPVSQKSGANIPLPPVPKSNARIELSALSKLSSQSNLPVAPKSLARIELPKELLSTKEEEAPPKEQPEEQSIVAPLPQDSTRIELPPQKSKLIAIVPPEQEPSETDPRKEESVAAPLPQDSTRIELPPQKSSGYAITTPPPEPHTQEQPQYDDQPEDEDFQSRESMTETGLMISDVSGMPSERALLHLSTLVLQSPNGPLQVLADAPNFEEKLRAWAQLTGIFIQEVHNTDGRTSALLMLGEAPPPINQTQPVPITEAAKPQENRGSLCITKNSPEALFAAMMLANAAAAKGTQVEVLFCAFGVELLRAAPLKESPLKRLLQRLLAWVSPKQSLPQLDFQNPLSQSLGYKVPRQEAPSVANILANINPKHISFLVCSASLGLVGLAPNDMIKGPKLEVTDLSNFTEAARHGGFSFTF